MKDYVHVKCPGKTHDIGEHSVVYGEPAIIAAISMYSNVFAKNNNQVRLDLKNLGIERSCSVEDAKSFASSLDDSWKKCKEKKDFKEIEDMIKKDDIGLPKAWIGESLEQLDVNKGIDLIIDSKIPMGAGLGSSASVSVAIPAAIAGAYGWKLSRDKINKIAYELEKFNHGTPSGGDNSTCCYGGLIWFKKNPDSEPTIEQIRDEIPNKLENFVLIQTRGDGNRSTREMVSRVRNLSPEYREPRIKTLASATYEMRRVLKEGDFEAMKELMNLAHKNLAELGVSTDEMEFVHKKVKEIGGAIKITGAGGPRSCMIGYHQQKDRLTNLLIELGYQPWEVELGVDGVRTES